jgi:hypothetical protein
MHDTPTWVLHDFGDATGEDDLSGHAIVCPALGGEDHGICIYLREADPLAHAAEIVAALNEHEARKARQEAPDAR